MNNFNFLDEAKFLNAYDEKKATMFLNIDMPKIEWEEVLEFINNKENKKVGGNYILTSPYAFFHNEAQKILKVNKFVKEVHNRFDLDNLEDKTLSCQLFGCLMTDGDVKINKHSDLENNIFWQGKGVSRWRLYESFETNKPYLDVFLEEGDLLYIPSKTMHYVEPVTPRFGFATLFGNKKSK